MICTFSVDSSMRKEKRVLIVATGGIGKRHIRGFLATRRARLSVVEPIADRLAEVLDAYPIEHGYADVRDVELSDFDLAVICAPAHLHIPLAQRCADAGVSFLVEKPLSVAMDGVDKLVATVAERGLVARVGYTRRSADELIAMRNQVLDGRIGDLRMCYMNASQEYPKYRPDYRDIYFAHAETGGGAILDGASHMIDILIWFFGDPGEVAAMYDRLELEGVECEDTCLISIRFSSGCLAQINMNQFQKPNTSRIEMIGTKGNLLLEHTKLRFSNDDSGNWEEQDFMDGMAPMEAHEKRFQLQANMMLDTLEGKPDHMATLEEARTNLRVALAAKESFLTKRIIDVSKSD